MPDKDFVPRIENANLPEIEKVKRILLPIFSQHPGGVSFSIGEQFLFATPNFRKTIKPSSNGETDEQLLHEFIINSRQRKTDQNGNPEAKTTEKKHYFLDNGKLRTIVQRTFPIDPKGFGINLNEITVSVFIDITEEGVDKLTHLPTRGYLEDHLTSLCEDRNSQFGIIFCDVDYFKKVNDNLGHKVGDEVLQKIASALRTSFRDEDLVCRHAGDEFVIVIINANETIIKNALSRISKIIETIYPNGVKGVSINNGALVTVNIDISSGSVLKKTGEDANFIELLDSADQEMYKYKGLKKFGDKIVRITDNHTPFE